MPVNKKKNEKKAPVKKKKIFPERNGPTPTIDDTTMSSGNLVNNPAGRVRTRTPRPKIAITGSDDDGQAI